MQVRATNWSGPSDWSPTSYGTPLGAYGHCDYDDDGSDTGGGGGPTTEPEPERDDPEPQADHSCQSRIAPYWHGTGGFGVRPTDAQSAIVRVQCGTSRYWNREYAGDEGLIVRTVRLSMCVDRNGSPISGSMTIE